MILRYAIISVLGLAVLPAVMAAEPVRIDLRSSAATTTAVVTLGDIATLDGGDDTLRATLSKLDVSERPKKDSSWSLTKRQIEFRLKIAGYSAKDYHLTGEDRIALAAVRTTIDSDRIVKEATEELLRRLSRTASEVTIDLVQPISAVLPEVAPDDDVKFATAPHVPTVRLGRVQMNVTIHVNGEKRLALPVFLNATQKPVPKVAVAVVPIPKLVVEKPLVKAQQRVTMTVRLGELVVSAQGDSLQDGKLGQTIRVLNIDSKKIVVGTVSGAGAVDVELPGGKP